MKEDLKIKADTKRGSYLFILLIGGLSFCSISFYWIYESLNNPYPQILDIAMEAFFGILGLLSLYYISKLDGLEIYTDRLEIKSIFGYTKRTIYLKDIITWTEIEKETKYTTWTDLTIYTERSEYNISSSIYNNFPLIRKELIKGKQRDLERQNNWYTGNARQWGIGFLILGGLFLIWSYYSYTNLHKEIPNSDITTLEQIVTSKIEIHRGPKSARSLDLMLKQYPEFCFEVEGSAFAATIAGAFVADIKTGDTLLVDIKTEDYQMKLTKEKVLGFFDKTINYSFIPVYGLRAKNNTYLTLANYNKEKKSEDPWFVWLFAILGIGFIITAFYQFKRYEK